MSELLANALPHVAAQEGNENWDEEEPYESGILCPSEDSKPTTTAKTSVNRLAQKPDKLPVHMESMRHEIEFRQSNRSADFIQGVDEDESDNRFINRGRLLHTLFQPLKQKRTSTMPSTNLYSKASSANRKQKMKSGN